MESIDYAEIAEATCQRIVHFEASWSIRVERKGSEAEARELEEIGEEQNNLTIARTKLPEVQEKSFEWWNSRGRGKP